jgi:hypothetical protein
MIVKKELANVADVMASFFPSKTLGIDYAIMDDGGDSFKVICDFKLPTFAKMRGRSIEIALEQTRTTALLQIDAFHSKAVERMVGNPTAVERDTWPLKLDAARAIQASEALSPSSEAFLTEAGIVTDGQKSSWAASVLSSSQRYAKVVGVAERLRRAARLAVLAADSPEAIAEALGQQKAAAENAESILLASQP